MGSRGRCCFLGLFLFLSPGGFQGIHYPTLPASTVPYIPSGGILGAHEGIWGILSYDKFAEPQDYGSSDQVLVLKVVGLETGCGGSRETGMFSELMGGTVRTLIPVNCPVRPPGVLGWVSEEGLSQVGVCSSSCSQWPQL